MNKETEVTIGYPFSNSSGRLGAAKASRLKIESPPLSSVKEVKMSHCNKDGIPSKPDLRYNSRSGRRTAWIVSIRQ